MYAKFFKLVCLLVRANVLVVIKIITQKGALSATMLIYLGKEKSVENKKPTLKKYASA